MLRSVTSAQRLQMRSLLGREHERQEVTSWSLRKLPGMDDLSREYRHTGEYLPVGLWIYASGLYPASLARSFAAASAAAHGSSSTMCSSTTSPSMVSVTSIGSAFGVRSRRTPPSTDMPIISSGDLGSSLARRSTVVFLAISSKWSRHGPRITPSLVLAMANLSRCFSASDLLSTSNFMPFGFICATE